MVRMSYTIHTKSAKIQLTLQEIDLLAFGRREIILTEFTDLIAPFTEPL
jgi:hypothetical protein